MAQTQSPEPQRPIETQPLPMSSEAPYSPVSPPPEHTPEHTPEPGALVPTEPPPYAPSSSTTQPMTILEANARPATSPHRLIEEPRRRNAVWQGIKWPLRKALLGAYDLTEAVRRHKRVTLVICALLLALIATGVGVYQLTRPAPPPVTIEQPTLPQLPASVIHYLHARQHFDAAEMLAAYNATARGQLKTTQAQLQTALNQEKSAGLQITRYVYTGGYQAPGGVAHYTIEVYASEQGQSGVFTWYFEVGPDGLIVQRLDLTPQ